MNFMSFYQHPARIYILAFNVIAMTMSVVLAGVGMYDLSSSSRLLLESSFLSWSLIALGLFVFLVSILGCAAAVGSSKPILGSYGMLLSLPMLLQISVMVYSLIQHDKVDDILNNAWQKAYDQHPRTLQDLEIRLGCCGFFSVGDRAIPKSSKYACRDSPAFGYDVPCQSQLKEACQMNENMLLSVVTVILLLQLMVLASMVALWLQLPREEEIEDQYRADHSERLLRGLQEEDGDRTRYGSTDNQDR